MKLKIFLAAALSTCLLPAFANAGPGEGNGPQGSDKSKAHPGAMFNTIDANKDGLLSKEEVDAEGPKHLQKKFDKIDRNGDGFLSKVEVREHHQKMKEKMKGEKSEKWDKKQGEKKKQKAPAEADAVDTAEDSM